MPKYTSKNISGDAGEYLVAYVVTHKLGWPFRLLGVDLGVDGELEVLNDDGESDGDVIKVQVKALAALSDADNYVYVDEEHIKYWKNFSAPIIVCCVDHAAATVYWQSIYQTETYLSAGEARRLTFNPRTSHRLDASSKKQFRELVTPSAAKDFTAELAVLRAYILEWRTTNGITVGRDGGRYLDEVYGETDKILAIVTRLRDGVRNFPFRFSPFDKQDIDDAERMVRTVRRFVDEAAKDQFY